MTDLTTNMLAPEFVNKLNENLREAASSSGGGIGYTRTIYLQMQGGKLVSGYTGMNDMSDYGTGASSASNSQAQIHLGSFFKTIHSVLMLNVENCAITNIGVESGETLNIACFLQDGTFSQSVSSVSAIPSGTCFVKFMLTKDTEYVSIRQLSVTVNGNPKLVKNSVPALVEDKFFSFETTYPSYFETEQNSTSYSDVEESGKNYIGANATTRYFDNGLIKLPPNYTSDGVPVPLIVNVHGTNGFDFFKGPRGLYTEQMNFLANNGYAVCDCSGVTNAGCDWSYSKSTDSTIYDDVFWAPSFISCIVSLVKFIYANYNVKEDGVYLCSKSAGGYTLHLLTQMSGLNIKAAASFAPGISPIATLAHYNYAEAGRTQRALSQLGISSISNAWYSDISVIHKLRQIDALFMGADLPDEEVMALSNKLYTTSGVTYGSGNRKRDFTLSSECMNGFSATIDNKIINCTGLGNARLHLNVPTKIWVATDDVNISYNMAKLYVDMAQRAGCPCYLRRMPTGTGAHHSVDTDSKAPKVTYKTKYAGSTTIAVAYAEAVDWFNRW